MNSSTSSYWLSSVLGHHILRLGGLITSKSRCPLPSVPKELGDCHDRDAGIGQNSACEQDWCRTKPNEYGQQQCRGCNEICSLMRWGEVQRRRDGKYQGRSQPRIFHASYRELDLCANVSRCDTCRTIRRAFLLAQITGAGAQSLEHPDQQWPIYAVLDLSSSGDSLLLSIDTPHAALCSAVVPLRREMLPTAHDPTRGGGRLRTDFEELRRVVRECHDHHGCSWKYRWSDKNPSWLLEILPDNQARLVKGPASPVDYVVLSYSWGDPTTMPPAEWARIKAAATKSKDGHPVLDRLHPFARWALPETMQDAITITESLGFRYIWIDSVCIPKGTNWDAEASVMHEVYGNAAFTLAASSCTKATDHLLHDRLAWTHRSKACKLRGMWLLDDHISLDEVRLGSPVSQRGWTLQEERLSPKILYWASQRWYWSCPERQVAELSQLGCTPPLVEDGAALWSRPQQFLEVCRIGEEQQLDEEWLDVVEAYTRRDLARAKDRFLAISGLAVRFYNSKVETFENDATEEYLAGLWRDNLARHLAWSVDKACNPEDNLLDVAPSWSWASLPLKTRTKAKHVFRQSDHFRFISSSGGATGQFKNRGQLVEARGRTVKTIEVQGRLRRFISNESQEVRWEDVEKSHGGRVDFSFCMLPGRPIHARNPKDGRLVAKEAHRGEIVAQLDYLPAQTEEAEKEGSQVYLAEGVERELFCLEVGDLAMLLLQRVTERTDAYRRVGVCIGYTNRKGFFYGCEARRIQLC